MTDKRRKLKSAESVPLHLSDVNEQPFDDRRRLLVIDDSDQARRAVVEFFRQRGWHVVSTRGVLAAVELATQQQPHAIVTELVLPDAQGCQFVRSLRAAVEHDIAIVGVTADSTSMSSVARAAGVDAVLPKPLDLVGIETSLASLVR